MEMSQEVLIDFGLNLAGYIVVVLLAYVLFRMPHRTRSKKSQPVNPVWDELNVAQSKPVVTAKTASTPLDYIALAEMKMKSTTGTRRRDQSEADVNPSGNRETSFTRRNNRREIYKQARELLSKGKSGRELLEKLPITEGELEMLSLARKA